MVRGTVKAWDNDAGTGVLHSPELPREVLADVAAVRGRARDLPVGTTVLFDYEPGASDADAFRARWIKPRLAS